MPIYEYRCPDCGHQFENLQKFSDPPVTECPECSAGNVKKLISRTSFVLKGGGWYADHYGLKSGGDAAASSSADAAPADAGSAASSTPAASDTAASTPAPSAPAPTTSSTGD